MSIRRIPNGRYQADVSDERRGIPRTRRTFTSRREAKEWEAAVRTEAHDRLLGRRSRPLFGQALARYLDEESPAKRTHQDDLDNLVALRWPVPDGSGGWRTLEHAPLDDGPQGIIAAMAAWSADQRAVLRRAHLEGETYQQRRTAEGLRWYWQPRPGSDARPRPRVLVTDRALEQRLGEQRGRGPYSTGTLRVRQALVRRVLSVAYRQWRLIDVDLAPLIDTARPAAARTNHLTPEQLTALVLALPPHLDDAALGAAWIGWRRANLLGRYSPRRGRDIEGLTWDRVVFPIEQEGRIVQPGYLWYEAEGAKNRAAHELPMSARIEGLLRTRWTLRKGPLVFHDGTGRPFGDFRKTWASALRTAGLPPGIRWHDLRHTWASELALSGATDRQIQELGGWKQASMVSRYAHLRREHLLDVLERVK